MSFYCFAHTALNPSFEKKKVLNLLHPRMLYDKFGWNWPSGSGDDFLKFHQRILRFVIISPCKRAKPFIWNNLNPYHPRMLCAKFSWNWPGGSWEDENVKSLQTNEWTDGHQEIRKAHLIFQLRWANKSILISQMTCKIFF